MERIQLVVGYDPREAVVYHVFCQSVLERSSMPVAFTPLTQRSIPEYREEHLDGSNSFTYTRFLVPYLFGFKGWAIFADGDMVCNEDIAKLWSLRDPSKAVLVVKHEYSTTMAVKYWGKSNENYPRKNWSSVILWNCEHPANAGLSPDYVRSKTGAHLHRFQWLDDELIGSLPITWNWLAKEYPSNQEASLIHYTLGAPCFENFKGDDLSASWYLVLDRMIRGLGD